MPPTSSAQADLRIPQAATATAPGRLGTHRGASGNSRRTFPSQDRTSRNKINVVDLPTDPQLMGALGAAEYARQKGSNV